MYTVATILTIVVLQHKASWASNSRSCQMCECKNSTITCVDVLIENQQQFNMTEDITTVHFTRTPIETIKNKFFTSENLQNITWISSNIKKVESLDQKKLKYLDLSKNVINELSPDAFANCPQLEYIDLSNNRISYIPDNLFLETSMLKVLKLENNNFNAIPKHLFSNLENLEYLNVADSGLYNISFGPLKNLRSIIISNSNNLSTIEEDSFSSTPNIEVIEINNCNKLQTLPNTIASLKNLKKLHMANTKMEVNCYNGWFMQWVNETNVIEGFEGYSDFVTNINKLDCPPKIYYTTGPVVFQLTENGTIECKAYGNPYPAITWLAPGGRTFHENKETDKNFTDHPKVHDWENKPIYVPSIKTDLNGSMHISRVLRDNIGNYTCYVSNIHGHDSQVVVLRLDSSVFFNIKINAILLGLVSAIGFLMLTILCCAFKLLLIKMNCMKARKIPVENELETVETEKHVPEQV
ncbi:peroxidasin homolog [Adelges cooleyi]|uniref:peroxidasin homolog n=1 Tax=Adelges cooleyi TaxID=133065 RepID=UPI00217F3057|nr:peroxidasin homolog [Adelges cooleyi]